MKKLLVLLIFITACTSINQVCIGNNCYEVMVLDDNQEMSKGLMDLDNLEENKGAFFIFEQEAKHGFWMKNVRFPIDIIWIDRNLNVVDVKENAQPCTEKCQIYNPKTEALYVLEMNINSNIKVGDKVVLR